MYRVRYPNTLRPLYTITIMFCKERHYTKNLKFNGYACKDWVLLTTETVEKEEVNRLEKSLSKTNPSHQQHTDITEMINTAQTVSFQSHSMLFLQKTQSIDPTFAHTHTPHINKQSCALDPTLFPPPLTQHPLISNLSTQT